MRLKILLGILGVLLVGFVLLFIYYGPFSEASKGNPGRSRRAPAPSPSASVTPTASATPIADLGYLYGVTVDDISSLSATKEAITRLPKKMTVRIVFDYGMNPSDYETAVTGSDGIAYTMGEPVDSSDMRRYSVDSYRARFTNYINAFKNKIDIWEIGNEVNGEWLGNSTDTSAKIAAAYDVAKAAGVKTALTLHFNEGADCPTYPQYEMYSWVNSYVPTSIKQGVDYVFFSYYPENCPEIKPNWPSEFTKIGAIFPNSKLGFGEIGYETGTQAQKEALIKSFYPMQIANPRYVGGHFWWYFREEMVPSTQYLWGVLNQTLTGA